MILPNLKEPSYILRLPSIAVARVDAPYDNVSHAVPSSKSTSSSIFHVSPSAPVITIFPVNCTSNSVNKNDVLWHQRMQHIPFVKMIFIPHSSCKFSSKQSFTCPICPMERQ